MYARFPVTAAPPHTLRVSTPLTAPNLVFWHRRRAVLYSFHSFHAMLASHFAFAISSRAPAYNQQRNVIAQPSHACISVVADLTQS